MMMRVPSHDSDLAQLLAVSGMTPESPANIGRDVRMNSQGDGAGGFFLRDTQLISQRVSEPKQWVVALRQASKASGVIPWLQDFDGGTYTAGTSKFGAPNMPSSGGSYVPLLQATVRWGAGGASWFATFDYPTAGRTFGLVADTLDINIAVKFSQNQNAVAAADVPVLGAFMVPGQPTDPHPLRSLDPIGGIAAINDSAFYSVKPFAKKVHLTLPGATKVSAQFLTTSANGATFGLPSLTLVPAAAGATIDAVLDVPAQAEMLVVTQQAANATTVWVEWWQGLS